MNPVVELRAVHKTYRLGEHVIPAVRGVDLSGCIRIGLQEDFGEHLLSRMLGSFARAHPKVIRSALRVSSIAH